jgi:aminobenzoyl-glutamate utilization protein B
LFLDVGEVHMNAHEIAVQFLDDRSETLSALAADIWRHPEAGFKEVYASDLLGRAFEDAGFRLRKPVAGIPTAFVAEFGEGTPVIGVLGEYDALPGLSQKMSAVREPFVDGGPGHGCGHNLLGVGGFGAALAAKAAMESVGQKGTVRYFGCPAEETLMGKVFMARDGVFDGLDAALTWHPMYANTVWAAASAALNSFRLSFHGRSAHAAGAPEAGRSALDAVVLTEVGVNFLREHMSNDYRIHCVVTHGGEAPNIVPAFAQSWYYVRAPRRSQVEEMYERVLNVARGAAPPFDEADLAFARELQATLPAGGVDDAVRTLGRSREELGDPLCMTVLDDVANLKRGTVQPVSTDVGDVSYLVPTAQLTACSIPLGVQIHSWQAVASCGSPIGFKSMLFAAKSLAFTILDLLQSPGLVHAAFREFETATGGRPYSCPIPAGLTPHVV